jgi:murein DD-endopeptidase MepM/ murein hydrolase activator NlpD
MKWAAAALWGLIIGALFGMDAAPPQVIEAAPQAIEQQAAPLPLGRKSVVTADMFVSAGFYATGAPAWNGGIHSGVDYAAAEGSPVYMPFDCAYTMTGFYGDAGRFGEYLMCYFGDGYEYYTGHLQGVRAFGVGEMIPAGTHIGWTNGLDHTHVQLRDTSGNLVDFEEYYAAK